MLPASVSGSLPAVLQQQSGNSEVCTYLHDTKCTAMDGRLTGWGCPHDDTQAHEPQPAFASISHAWEMQMQVHTEQVLY